MSATKQIISFGEYLTYADGTDTCYELQDGELVAITPGRGKNGAIAEFLNDRFRSEIQRLGLDWVSKKGDIGVKIPQVGRGATSKFPDIAVV
jgi:Uma2 family endonuclease